MSLPNWPDFSAMITYRKLFNKNHVVMVHFAVYSLLYIIDIFVFGTVGLYSVDTKIKLEKYTLHCARQTRRVRSATDSGQGFRDRRLPPRLIWILPSSGLLRDVRWRQLDTWRWNRLLVPKPRFQIPTVRGPNKIMKFEVGSTSLQPIKISNILAEWLFIVLGAVTRRVVYWQTFRDTLLVPSSGSIRILRWWWGTSELEIPTSTKAKHATWNFSCNAFPT